MEREWSPATKVRNGVEQIEAGGAAASSIYSSRCNLEVRMGLALGYSAGGRTLGQLRWAGIIFVFKNVYPNYRLSYYAVDFFRYFLAHSPYEYIYANTISMSTFDGPSTGRSGRFSKSPMAPRRRRARRLPLNA
jgi:hypothetical protein